MKITAEQHRPFGNTGLRVPPILFGTAALGNVPRVIPDQTKAEIVGEWIRHVAPPVFIETAGEYGAGAALETLRRVLQRLEIPPGEVIVAHRLGWRRSDESGPRMSYNGVRESFHRDCRLLGEYSPQLVSIHRPDEYLATANTPAARDRCFREILDAYRALADLKSAGKVAAIGASAADWRLIEAIEAEVQLDWVMFVGSLTVMRHPPGLLDYATRLANRKIAIVNSGVFHCGFLLGGSKLDGRTVIVDDPAEQAPLAWRKAFAALCYGHGITPAHACIQFALSAPSVVAVTLNTTHPDRIAENVQSATADVPAAFWASIKEEGLLAADVSFVE